MNIKYYGIRIKCSLITKDKIKEIVTKVMNDTQIEETNYSFIKCITSIYDNYKVNQEQEREKLRNSIVESVTDEVKELTEKQIINYMIKNEYNKNNYRDREKLIEDYLYHVTNNKIVKFEKTMSDTYEYMNSLVKGSAV